MKHVYHLIVYFTMLIITVFSTMVYVKAGVSDGLTLYCTFDNNYKDQTAKTKIAHYGTLKYGDGIQGQSIYMDSKENYLSLGNGLNLTGDFSFSIWLKSGNHGKSDATLLAKSQTKDYGPYSFYLSYDRPAFRVADGKGGYEIYISEASINSNEWSMVTYTYKKSASKLMIYINGKYKCSFTGISLIQNNEKVTVGQPAYLYGVKSRLKYRGYMDELRLYNRTLSSSEISTLYKNNIKNPTITSGSKSKPATPSIVNIYNTNKGIRLNWTQVSNASGYMLYRKTGLESYELIKKITKNSTTSYTDTSVKNQNGKAYTYVMYAYRGSVRSSASKTSYLLRLSTASLRSVKYSGNGNIVVTWNANSVASGYEVQYSTNKTFLDSTKTIVVSVKKARSKMVNGLDTNKIYYIRVRSYTGAQGSKKYYSPYSSIKSVRTMDGKASTIANQAVTVKFKLIVQKNEQLITTGYDKNGNIVWEYKTDSYPIKEFSATYHLEENNRIYIFAGSSITVLSKSTGKIIWAKKNLAGYGVAADVDRENNLYFASCSNDQYVYKINSKGEMVWKTNISKTGKRIPLTMIYSVSVLVVDYKYPSYDLSGRKMYSIAFNASTGKIRGY